MTYQDLEIVVAARDLPKQTEDEQAVPAGTEGTIVSVLGKDSYWVEFLEDDGYTMALMVLEADDIAPVPPQKEKAATA